MNKLIKITLLLILITFNYAKASPSDAQKWLDTEITKIINLYKNQNVDNINRLNAIEEAINKNFAGTGIARFVVSNVWKDSSKETQQKFVKLFKQHLYLTIASLMQGYSDQSFKFIEAKEDKNQNVYLIDMEIEYNDQKTTVTWRVKESNEKYYVIDLLVADISLVVTKRAEFNSMLKKVNNDLNELNLLLEKQNNESYERLIN